MRERASGDVGVGDPGACPSLGFAKLLRDETVASCGVAELRGLHAVLGSGT
ncbi:MAG TPA: hypothetical protein VMI75_31305 [Polyangiaceae bacterium]|nr:hypothetical protein [Polyangiaceae bacterium]